MLPRIKRRNERERGGRNRQTDRLKQIQRLGQRDKKDGKEKVREWKMDRREDNRKGEDKIGR